MKASWLLALTLVLTTACHRDAVPTTASDCIDSTKINPQGMCPMDYNPVCGCDGKTYSNSCVAANAGVRTTTPGPCAAAPAK